MFEEINIICNNKPLSKTDYYLFNLKLLEVVDATRNNRMLIFHPGTRINLTITTVFFVLNCFLNENSDQKGFIESFNVGDIFVYKKERGEFIGFDEEDRIILKNSKGLLKFPKSRAHLMTKYLGTATKLNGTGIRSKEIKLKSKILSDIFGITIEESLKRMDCSIVIVCDKAEADFIAEEIYLESNSRERLPLCELFPSAYYTSSGPMYYSGNSSKSEPIIKITNKMSIARELIIDDRDKKILGLIVNGRNHIEQVSELSSLINRKSLKNVVLLANIAVCCSDFLDEQYDDLKQYMWTKQGLIDRILFTTWPKKKLDNYSKFMLNRIKNAVNCKLEIIEVESQFDYPKVQECRKMLISLMKKDINNKELDELIHRGFGLIKLIESACFSLLSFDEMIKDRLIASISPTEQLIRLRKIASTITYSEGYNLTEIANILEVNMSIIYNVNNKHDSLFSVLYKVDYTRNILIVVPKTSYWQVIIENAPLNIKKQLQCLAYSAPSKYDHEKIYDIVIFIGVHYTEFLNPYRLYNASQVYIIAYSWEVKTLKYLHKKDRDLERNYNIRNGTLIEQIEYENENHDNFEDIVEEQIVTKDIETFININKLNGLLYAIDQCSTNSDQMVEIERAAVLENDEVVFFTKYYVTYVFDHNSQTVIEKDIHEIKIGDNLIFTLYDDHTRDIVDQLLLRIVDTANDRNLRGNYEKSIYWKKLLDKYINENGLSFYDLSKKLEEIGCVKHEVTLRSWLSTSSHIVGPRDAESFYAIALLTNDLLMLENPDIYCFACKEIRNLRTRILKDIGISIIDSMNKTKSVKDEMFENILKDISKMAKIVQVASITDVKDIRIPTYLANKLQERLT